MTAAAALAEGRVVRHGRYVISQLAEVAVARRSPFAAILWRIGRLRGPPLPAV